MTRTSWLTRSYCGLGTLALLAMSSAAQAQNLNAQRAHILEVGKQIFEKQWESGRPAQPGGDGLGPVFNATSCVACHFQGGPGGGGPVDVNAEMLSLLPPAPNSPLSISEYFKVASVAHVGLTPTDGMTLPNVILHRFGVDERYATLRMRLTGAAVPFKPDEAARTELQYTLASMPVKPVSTVPGVRLVMSQRNTPAMFGLALIDDVPDALLHNIAAAQAKQHPGISGRVAPVQRFKVGRFGWRGQIDHLKEFVLGACANELGLQVPGNGQQLDPLNPDYRPTALDLNQAECDALAAFCASLPPPKVVIPADPEQAKVAEFGYKVFHQVGCSACHIENVGKAQQIYSDLLLHDMGPKLADPVVSQASLVKVEEALVGPTAILKQEGNLNILSNSGVKAATSDVTTTTTKVVPPTNYYGGGTMTTTTTKKGDTESAMIKGTVDKGYEFATYQPLNAKTALRTTYRAVPTNLDQEWRTPPLWGVHDSAPYLHDGRAETLVEAIALHGGEGADCAARYFDLPAGEQLALIEYLHCLRAP